MKDGAESEILLPASGTTSVTGDHALAVCRAVAALGLARVDADLDPLAVVDGQHLVLDRFNVE